MINLLVDSRGDVLCLYGEEIDLASIGVLRIRRASHVEPDAFGRWWADLSPVGGPVLGPFGRRGEALATESNWLGRHLHCIGEPDATPGEQAGQHPC